MTDIVVKNQTITENSPETAYKTIRGYVVNAQQKVCYAVNSAMVEAYWNIGKAIYEYCGENDRAEYGAQILTEISERLTSEFGKGYSITNLRGMRRFYLAFPKRSTLWSELSWSHYRLLMRVENEEARAFYAEEAAKAGWRTHRQHTAFKLHKNCIKSKNDAERSSLTEKYGFYE